MQKRRVLYLYADTVVDGGRYVPHVFEALRSIRREREMDIVLVDELPDAVLSTLSGEDIYFDDDVQDGDYDRDNSYTVVKGGEKEISGCRPLSISSNAGWLEIAHLLCPDRTLAHRMASFERNTKETQISLSLDLDGSGKGELRTGVGFFDHMLEQVIKHSRCDISGTVHGDLEVDEHHTVEDLGITLGLAFREALGDKRGINRYGHDILIMDDVVCTCAIDFSGRPYLLWKVDFKRQEVGGFPTEMFQHFFKSFSDASQCNLSIEVTDGNTHHQAEAIFKAFARAAKMAVRRIPGSNDLPSTKGVL